jgi:hypothetical protein
MPPKVYYGSKPTPGGRQNATMKQSIDNGQVRLYGILKVDPAMIKESEAAKRKQAAERRAEIKSKSAAAKAKEAKPKPEPEGESREAKLKAIRDSRAAAKAKAAEEVREANLKAIKDSRAAAKAAEKDKRDATKTKVKGEIEDLKAKRIAEEFNTSGKIKFKPKPKEE